MDIMVLRVTKRCGEAFYGKLIIRLNRLIQMHVTMVGQARL